MQIKKFFGLILAILVLASSMCFISCESSENKKKTEELTELITQMFDAYNNEDFTAYASYYKTKPQPQIDFIIANLTEGTKYIKKTYNVKSLEHELIDDGRTVATIIFVETVTDLVSEDKPVTTRDVTAQAVLTELEDGNWSVDDFRLVFSDNAVNTGAAGHDHTH